MGQKVNPIGFRLGVIRDWNARWYANNNTYMENLISDLKIRRFLKQKLAHAAVSSIIIERPTQSINITVHTARPGIVIGKKGEDIEKLRQELMRLAGVPVTLSVQEVRQPELDSQLHGTRPGAILEFNATLPERFGDRAGEVDRGDRQHERDEVRPGAAPG